MLILSFKLNKSPINLSYFDYFKKYLNICITGIYIETVNKHDYLIVQTTQNNIFDFVMDTNLRNLPDLINLPIVKRQNNKNCCIFNIEKLYCTIYNISFSEYAHLVKTPIKTYIMLKTIRVSYELHINKLVVYSFFPTELHNHIFQSNYEKIKHFPYIFNNYQLTEIFWDSCAKTYNAHCNNEKNKINSKNEINNKNENENENNNTLNITDSDYDEISKMLIDNI